MSHSCVTQVSIESSLSVTYNLCFILKDDELPDYIMVMLANKRSKEQMAEDLILFLGTNTGLFTDW